MQTSGTLYTIGFAAAVCVVCSLLVSSSATLLKSKQAANAVLDKQKKVLSVSGLIEEGTSLSASEVKQLFDARIRIKVITLETGEEAPEGTLDPATYDQVKSLKDMEMSRAVDRNRARVARVPLYTLIYEVMDEEGQLELRVLPVEGKGLWSTLYGFLALDDDNNTIRGLTFYTHGETPGLGGEVDNRNWKAKWPGRLAFDEDGEVAIRVIKGAAGPPDSDPHRVDGLSGATLTSNGVTNLLRFWLGEEGFGPFLARLRAEGSSV